MGRLADFREFKKLKPKAMAEALGLEYQAYYQYEKETRRIPQETLERLAGLGLNLNWLATGQGPMVAITGVISAKEEGDPPVTPGFPEREIVRAVEIAYRLLGVATLPPTKMGWIVATIAEMLVRGRSEEEISEAARPMIRALAYSGLESPPGTRPG